MTVRYENLRTDASRCVISKLLLGIAALQSPLLIPEVAAFGGDVPTFHRDVVPYPAEALPGLPSARTGSTVLSAVF